MKRRIAAYAAATAATALLLRSRRAALIVCAPSGNREDLEAALHLASQGSEQLHAQLVDVSLIPLSGRFAHLRGTVERQAAGRPLRYAIYVYRNVNEHSADDALRDLCLLARAGARTIRVITAGGSGPLPSAILSSALTRVAVGDAAAFSAPAGVWIQRARLIAAGRRRTSIVPRRQGHVLPIAAQLFDQTYRG